MDIRRKPLDFVFIGPGKKTGGFLFLGFNGGARETSIVNRAGVGLSKVGSGVGFRLFVIRGAVAMAYIKECGYRGSFKLGWCASQGLEVSF